MKPNGTFDLKDIRNRVIELKMLKPTDLLDHPGQWRDHPPSQAEAMAGALREVGQTDALKAWYSEREGGKLVTWDGHLRKSLSPDVLWPVLITDLTDAEADYALATHDPLASMAHSDAGALDALLASINSAEPGIQAMLAELAQQSGLDYFGGDEPVEAPEPQIDRAAELQEKWQTERGQLWVIPSLSVPGREHRLLCGDSTSAEDVARLMGGEQAAVVFADPPYGISIVAANGYVSGGEAYNIPFGGVKNHKGLGTVGGSKPFGSKDVRGTVGASHVVEAGKYLPVKGDDTTETAINAYRLLSRLYPSAVHVWWGGNYYANALPPSSCWLVWDKETTGNFADCELAWTNQPTAVRRFKHRWNGMLRESERGRRMHPTQKPIALAAWCFEQYGKQGDLIIDPFSGAGMAVVAAEQTNRLTHAIEWEADYIALILQRMADMGLEPRLSDG